MVKKIGFLVGIICVLFVSCGKKADNFDPAVQAATDDATIQAYIKANNITAIKDASGLYYQIVIQGTGATPSATTTTSVNYTGKFLDGTVFDSNSGKGSFNVVNLSGVISGWTIGLPYCKVGGRILLLIPSGLAYGPSGYSTIPANTPLAFTIDVVTVK